jgi:hypothetical protein
MEKKYTFTQGTRKFFRAYVEMIRPFLKNIRTREADVFAELLYYNYVKKEIKDPIDRSKIVLGPEIRRDIEKQLHISTAIFRNALSGLRAKGLVKEDNTISETYLVMTDDKKVELKFIFVLEK